MLQYKYKQKAIITIINYLSFNYYNSLRRSSLEKPFKNCSKLSSGHLFTYYFKQTIFHRWIAKPDTTNPSILKVFTEDRIKGAFCRAHLIMISALNL